MVLKFLGPRYPFRMLLEHFKTARKSAFPLALQCTVQTLRANRSNPVPHGYGTQLVKASCWPASRPNLLLSTLQQGPCYVLFMNFFHCGPNVIVLCIFWLWGPEPLWAVA